MSAFNKISNGVGLFSLTPVLEKKYWKRELTVKFVLGNGTYFCCATKHRGN